MRTTAGTCAACGRAIDESARLCPYCGANPQTGERIDTQAMLEEVFGGRGPAKPAGVMEFARQRQGVVVALLIVVAFVVLAGLHQLVSMRNATAVTDSPAIPLTEVTDIASRAPQSPVRMPDLDFQYDGRPRAMRTYIVEPGAATPPEVVAAAGAAFHPTSPPAPVTAPPVAPAKTPAIPGSTTPQR